MKLVRHVKISARVNLFATVSARDFEKVSRYRWFEVNGYALCHPRRGKTLAMHRLVFGASKGVRVDHRDGNKRKKGFSRFKGVAPSISKTNPWQAYITVGGKYLYLGSFADEVSAARSYNEAASQHFGKFAKLNEIPDGESRVNVRSKSSKFPGVCWHKVARKWHARIVLAGKTVFNKLFDKEEDAFAAWKSAKGKQAAARLDIMADYL